MFIAIYLIENDSEEESSEILRNP